VPAPARGPEGRGWLMCYLLTVVGVIAVVGWIILCFHVVNERKRDRDNRAQDPKGEKP
jgi:hypothetical protein